MWHIHPLNDEREHVLEGSDCWCEPRIFWNDEETGEILPDGIAVHKSFDCREVVEQAVALMQKWESTAQ
jgi:hypothetical protein